MPGLGRGNASRDYALCTKHSCKRCAKCGEHTVQGPAAPAAGAQKVFVNGFPALRVGDMGQHDKQTCCGPNKWIAQSTTQQRKVHIEGKEAFCVGDITLHDQKDQGKLMVGSTNVCVKGK